ncbi:hypothetical protein HMPREF3227_02139 [Corynebacterium sp. CMW7794]|nr:hypothetical protein HMPREF3227_02139 [Corynebacterium sp. CMW7794]
MVALGAGDAAHFQQQRGVALVLEKLAELVEVRHTWALESGKDDNAALRVGVRCELPGVETEPVFGSDAGVGGLQRRGSVDVNVVLRGEEKVALPVLECID